MRNVLTSWKEIASYVGKGTRTVQRWERDLGLPIRRVERSHGYKSTVLAIREEIDSWVQSQHFRNGNTEFSDAEVVKLRNRVAVLQSEIADLRQRLEMFEAKPSVRPNGDVKQISLRAG